jgi:hypothetical protein
MPAHLLALSEGPNLTLDKPITLVGRHAEADIQLNSRKVSRRHCVIAQISDYLIIRDLGSTNGVRINGNRMVEGKLKNGDELVIGNFRYRVAIEVELPKVHKLPLERTARNRKVSDEILEQSDRPIPLDESASVSVPRAKPVPDSLLDPGIHPDDRTMFPGSNDSQPSQTGGNP